MKAIDLKRILAQIPDDTDVVIHDADTDWSMSRIRAFKIDHVSAVALYCGYHDDDDSDTSYDLPYNGSYTDSTEIKP